MCSLGMEMLPVELTCITYGPSAELLVHLRHLQNTDPFEGTQEEKVCLEDVPVLPTDPDDHCEDTDIIVGYYK